MSDSRRQDRSAQHHSAEDLLRELFPDTHRELFGDSAASHRPGGSAPPRTLGLYPVADGRLALVDGEHLAELTPIDSRTRTALHCDLCQVTRSRSEAQIYRVSVSLHRTRYVTLCAPTAGCQSRAGRPRLAAFAQRLFGEGPRPAEER